MLKKILERIGVVNQTTMLASDTQAIADYLKNVMIEKYNLTEENISESFADTRDTFAMRLTKIKVLCMDYLKQRQTCNCRWRL